MPSRKEWYRFPSTKHVLIVSRIYEAIGRRGWSIVPSTRESNRSRFSRSRNPIHPPSMRVCRRWIKRGKRGGRKREREKKKKEEEGKKGKKEGKRGLWKVQPGFLEGNAPVNRVPAHKSSTINRRTGWAVNRKHVLRHSPTPRPSTLLFHANARHQRIFSFDCPTAATILRSLL